MAGENVNIVTYNILSNLLCTADTFGPPNYNNPTYIAKDYRYNLLKQRLNEWVKKSYIICLQEVDKDTSCKLQIYFKETGYDFYFDPYGSHFNGYMGTAVAMPDKYKALKLEKYRLSDAKRWPREPKPNTGYIYPILSWVTLGYIGYDSPKEYTVWKAARAKRNTMISILIKTPNGNIFSVSTLHMPCSFKNPSIMLTYSVLARYRAQKFAGNYPYVLAGDFNITKNEYAYKNLLESSFDTSCLKQDYHPLDEWDPNQLKLDELKSAHYEVHGSEPPFTCCSVNDAVGDGTVFCNTIDYILYNGMEVSDAHVILNSPRILHDLKPQPNKYEPSDHLPVSASFKFKAPIEKDIPELLTYTPPEFNIDKEND